MDTKLAFDANNLLVVDTFIDIDCLMEKDMVITPIREISYCFAQWFKSVLGLQFKEFQDRTCFYLLVLVSIDF